MKALRSILGLIRKADQKFDFFHENDKIMIGVSGGKDSMVLLKALSQYQHFKCVNFEIFPAILDLGFPGFDAEPIKEYVKTLGLELKVVDSKEVFQILKIQQKDAPNLPCSICSRMKKAAINKAAKELGCNKVAFAHHGDDAIETLFMNEIFGGRIASFQPKMHLDRADIEFIRPLILCHEQDIIKCQKEEKIPSFSSHCPNEGKTMRAEMKDLLNNLYKKYPSAKDNFFLMMENYDKEVLYYQDIFYKVERKDLSFKPVIKADDSRVETKLRLELKCLNLDEDVNRYVVYKRNTPIGVISFTKEEIPQMHDLALLKDYKKEKEVIEEFIANNLKYFNSPFYPM
jgi:tRNA(Ile)-lysidine synthase TilS/MesJ